jgi:hypothetical protein
MSWFIEDYSEKAIAVFGDTKAYKDLLVSLNGKFNPALKGVGDTKRSGWIFPKSKRAQVEAQMKQGPQSIPPASSSSSVTSGTPSSTPVKPTPTLPTSSATPTSSTSSDSAELLQRLEKVEKIMSNLTSRLEAVETELAASRKRNVKQMESSSVDRADHTDDEDEAPVAKSLMIRKKK